MGFFCIFEKFSRLAYKLNIPADWKSILFLSYPAETSLQPSSRFNYKAIFFQSSPVIVDKDTNNLNSFKIEQLLN